MRVWAFFRWPPILRTFTDRNHIALADLYGSSNRGRATAHRAAAAALRSAVLDLLWDGDKVTRHSSPENISPDSDHNSSLSMTSISPQTKGRASLALSISIPYGVASSPMLS